MTQQLDLFLVTLASQNISRWNMTEIILRRKYVTGVMPGSTTEELRVGVENTTEKGKRYQ